MKALKSITVAVSDPFRRDQPAVVKAAALASLSGARLTLLNTFMLPPPMSDAPSISAKQIIAAATLQRRRGLQAIAAKFRSKGLRVQCEVHWDFPPHEAIVRHVFRAKPDLLMFESHRHNRLVRFVLANTDWELIRSCPCPIWFVRSPKLRKRSKLLVAVDPSHSRAKPTRLDDYLLQAARTVAKKIGAKIDLAHAYVSPTEVVGTPFGEPIVVPAATKVVQAFATKVKKAVDKLASRYSIDPAACHVEAGTPEEVLVELATDLSADVLVMGAVSRSRLDRLLIGNTAERVIDHVECDVMVVKPAGYRSPVSRKRRASL